MQISSSKVPSPPEAISAGVDCTKAIDFGPVFDAAPALLLLLDRRPDFEILGATDAFLRAMRMRRETIVGRGVFDVFPSPQVQRATEGARTLRASLGRVLQTRAPDVMAVQRYDVRTLDADHRGYEARYWSTVTTPVLGPGGEVRSILLRLEDVSALVLGETAPHRADDPRWAQELVQRGELDEATRQLREANAQFQAVYDQGLFAGRLSLDGTVVDANHAWIEGCGYQRAQILGRPFWACGWWNRSPEVQAWVQEAVCRAVQGESFRGESRYFLADGSERIVDFACMPIKDADGRVLLALPTGMDVTERARAEQNRRAYEEEHQRALALSEIARVRHEAERRVREREEHLRAIVETTPESVSIVAADGTVLKMNPSGVAMVGARDEATVVGTSVYALIAPEDRARFRAFHANVCGGVKGTLELDLLEPGGGRRHVDLHAAPLAMPDGTTAGLALTRDITARRRAEQALRASDRHKDEFIATLSHELRNPLAPLRNAVSLLRVGGGEKEDLASLQAMMERQVDHLVRLVDDLLEISRISRGALTLRCERVDLSDIIRHAIETSDPLIRDAGHRLELALPAQPVPVNGDAVRLAQIFSNLLNNAARFTDPGGRISVSVRLLDGRASVAVRDTGRGFPPASAEALFEMFEKGDHSTGLGIGLALARRLTEMHGGQLAGRSEGLGRGAEFVVTLPVAARAQAAALACTSPARATATPRGRRVLIADDNRDAANSLAALLKALGHEVALAYDGARAVEVALQFAPEVALIDIGMPELDGHQAGRLIREQASGRPLTLVALTGWGQEEDRRRARHAGFDAHLVKPPELDDLCALLVDPADRRPGCNVGTAPLRPTAPHPAAPPSK